MAVFPLRPKDGVEEDLARVLLLLKLLLEGRAALLIGAAGAEGEEGRMLGRDFQVADAAHAGTLLRP